MITTLNNAFKDYFFTESDHSYVNTVTGEQLTSVTSLIKKLSPKFDSTFWLAYKTFEKNGYEVKSEYGNSLYFYVNGSKFNPKFDNIEDYDLEFTVEDMQLEWDLLAKIGNTRGTVLHNYMEYLWNRKFITEPMPNIINRLNAVEAIKYIKSIQILKDLGLSFLNKLKETHTFIASEYVVGDVELGIAGTFDLLLFNNITNKYEIWDYKTDKKFRDKGTELINGFLVPMCELNKYSLQLGIYKHIIEKNTDIEIDKCVIAHFNYKKNNVEIIETHDFSEQIKNYFNGNNKSTRL